jgi:bifunctional DNase/RNase
MIEWLKRILFFNPVTPPQPDSSASQPPLRNCERCEQTPVLHITTVNRSGDLSESHLCERCGEAFLSQLPSGPERPPTTAREVRVELERIVISEIHEQQVATLREVEGERRLSWMLGIFEATTLDRSVKKLPSPRPLTFDAWLTTLTALGAVVREICITDLKEGTYFAEVRLQHNGQVVRVDMRPSDAVVLAVKAGAAILVADRLFAVKESS